MTNFANTDEKYFRLAYFNLFVTWYAKLAQMGGPMLNRFNRVCTILVIFLAWFSVGIARADVTGAIQGVVHDSSGAVVGGAKIVATNVETNSKQETVSGSDGSFRILALAAGKYTLTVTAAGFETFSETGIEVKVNDQLHYDV